MKSAGSPCQTGLNGLMFWGLPLDLKWTRGSTRRLILVFSPIISIKISGINEMAILNSNIILTHIEMLTISGRISSLVTVIAYNTKKSKRTFTPRLFKNPNITPMGILTKPPRSYNYNLPEQLPNRHLYWNRAVQNKKLRERYNKRRLQKLEINPIHDEQGKPLMNRGINELISQLTNLNLIKQSLGRTLVNIHEAMVRFPNELLGDAPDADVLLYAFKEVHDRHLTAMSFYSFCTYCQLRYRAKLPPTEALMLHFYRFLEAARENPNPKLTVERLGQLSNYIFSREYPECINLMTKPKVTFELFGEGQETYITFQDILKDLYPPEYLKEVKARLNDKKTRAALKGIAKIPGGSKLVESINSAV